MTGMAKVMLDTNVIFYAATAEPADAVKHSVAIEIVRGASFVLCTQALHEFYDAATRGKSPPMSSVEALTWIEELEAFVSADLTVETVKAGAEIATRYGIRYGDGAMLAAAHQAGADTFISEDLNHGQLYGSVRVENPFKDL